MSENEARTDDNQKEYGQRQGKAAANVKARMKERQRQRIGPDVVVPLTQDWVSGLPQARELIADPICKATQNPGGLGCRTRTRWQLLVQPEGERPKYAKSRSKAAQERGKSPPHGFVRQCRVQANPKDDESAPQHYHF